MSAGQAMLTREQALATARSSGWLSRQSAALQDELLARCMLRSFARNETITNVGDPYQGVHALVSGIVKVENSAPGDDYRIATVKQPVFWFGQGASIARGPHLVTVTATSPAQTLFLPQADFERLIENAAHCRAFAVMTIEHVEEATHVVGQLLVSDAENRVAARLALLAERTGPARPAVITLSQSDLAEMCGLSRPTVQQILSVLEKRGLVRSGYRRIEVASPEALTGGRSFALVTSTQRETAE